MLFAGQPVRRFPCSKLIQDQMDLMQELRAGYQVTDAMVMGVKNWQFDYPKIMEVPEIPGSGHELRCHVHFACRATRLALKYALEHGIGINLGGGFHHATLNPEEGNNGCLVNDVILAITQTPEITDKRIAIIDLDAHCGGGTAKCVSGMEDYQIINLDLSDTVLSDAHDISWDGASPDYSHWECIQWALEQLQEFQPEVAFLNAGADVVDKRFMKEPLTVAAAAMYQQSVVDYCHTNSIPLCITLGGGYTFDALKVWRLLVDYCLALPLRT